MLEGADGATSTVTAPYQATDCAGLPFSPKIAATIGKRGETAKGKAPPLRVLVSVPAGQRRDRDRQRRASARLGIDLSGSRKACAPAAFAASACPATARARDGDGDHAAAAHAAHQPGHVRRAQAGSLPGLALTLTGAVSLPLFGEVGLPGKDGVIHNAFDGIPDVPLEQFELAFTGGATMPLTLRRDVCTGPRQTIRGSFTAPQRRGRQRQRAAEGRRLPAGRRAHPPRPPAHSAHHRGPRRGRDQERDDHPAGRQAPRRQGQADDHAEAAAGTQDVPGRRQGQGGESWMLRPE